MNTISYPNKIFIIYLFSKDSYEDYSEEEESRPSRSRRKHNGGSSRRNKHRYNSKRKQPFSDERRKGDKFRNRKDSAVKKERIPFLVPLMMVPENQVTISKLSTINYILMKKYKCI